MTPKKIDVVMHIYMLIEYSNVYSKTSESLWQYYRVESALNAANGEIIEFSDKGNDSASFKFKPKRTGQAENDTTKNVKIMVPLKNLSNFWRTFEMSLINCEINPQLKRSKNYILVADTVANQNPSFQIIDTKLYLPVLTLSTQENIKLP